MNKIMLNEDLKINNRLIPYSISFEQNEAEMSLTEHLEEVRQRAFWSLSLLVTTVLGCLITVKNIVKLLQEPAIGIKFLQLAPGEYFFASLKVAVPGKTQAEYEAIFEQQVGTSFAPYR